MPTGPTFLTIHAYRAYIPPQSMTADHADSCVIEMQNLVSINVNGIALSECAHSDKMTSPVTSAETETKTNAETAPIELSQLQYCNIQIQGIQTPLLALMDSGAQLSLISSNLIKDLDVPKLGTLSIKGVVGEHAVATVVSLNSKPHLEGAYENIAPYICITFTACDLTSDVDVI